MHVRDHYKKCFVPNPDSQLQLTCALEAQVPSRSVTTSRSTRSNLKSSLGLGSTKHHHDDDTTRTSSPTLACHPSTACPGGIGFHVSLDKSLEWTRKCCSGLARWWLRVPASVNDLRLNYNTLESSFLSSSITLLLSGPSQ